EDWIEAPRHARGDCHGTRPWDIDNDADVLRRLRVLEQRADGLATEHVSILRCGCYWSESGAQACASGSGWRLKERRHIEGCERHLRRRKIERQVAERVAPPSAAVDVQRAAIGELQRRAHMTHAPALAALQLKGTHAAVHF